MDGFVCAIWCEYIQMWPTLSYVYLCCHGNTHIKNDQLFFSLFDVKCPIKHFLYIIIILYQMISFSYALVMFQVITKLILQFCFSNERKNGVSCQTSKEMIVMLLLFSFLCLSKIYFNYENLLLYRISCHILTSQTLFLSENFIFLDRMGKEDISDMI